jgi:FMN reductase
MVENALDYLEDLRDDDPRYLDGRAVAASPRPAAGRPLVHALRGWPTPMGAALNTARALFDSRGICVDPSARYQLELVGRQVVEFARIRAAMAVGT